MVSYIVKFPKWILLSWNGHCSTVAWKSEQPRKKHRKNEMNKPSKWRHIEQQWLKSLPNDLLKNMIRNYCNWQPVFWPKIRMFSHCGTFDANICWNSKLTIPMTFKKHSQKIFNWPKCVCKWIQNRIVHGIIGVGFWRISPNQIGTMKLNFAQNIFQKMNEIVSELWNWSKFDTGLSLIIVFPFFFRFSSFLSKSPRLGLSPLRS